MNLNDINLLDRIKKSMFKYSLVDISAIEYELYEAYLSLVLLFDSEIIEESEIMSYIDFFDKYWFFIDKNAETSIVLPKAAQVYIIDGLDVGNTSSRAFYSAYCDTFASTFKLVSADRLNKMNGIVIAISSENLHTICLPYK